ncbi:MFS transporter [Homoserinimonas sp. A447]
MERTARSDPRPTVFLFLAVCVIAANMRATITGIGPLLEQISVGLGTDMATLGLLVAVPLIAWALVSPFAHDLSQRFGLSRVILWSLLILALGTIWRSVAGPAANVWIGTVLIGVALAIANVLMPAVVKQGFPGRVPAVMAIYTALLGGVGAIASGVVVPISHVDVGGQTWGWRTALVATGILLPLAVVLWAWASRRGGENPKTGLTSGRRQRTGIWSDALAWQIAVYTGLQSSAFYMLVTWLATLSTSVGRSETVAGFDVMMFQIMSVVGALAVPFILRGRAIRWVPIFLPTLAIIGTLGFILAPHGLLIWACLSGLSSGSSLGMTLTLMAQRARTQALASALSGMAQSIGYVIAAMGPFAFGWLLSLSGGWSAPLLLLLAALLGQAGVGWFVGRERYVLER